MKYVSLFALALLVGITIVAYAEDTKPTKMVLIQPSGACGECTAKEQAYEGDPLVAVQDVPGPGIVPKTCEKMEQEGFKTIVGIARKNEKIRVDRHTIKDGVDTYTWKALTYEGPVADRIAARELLKNGVPATRLEELKLVLEDKLPLAIWGGHWFPPKDQGVAFEFGYGKLGPNPKVETVATLRDGRVIKFVTQDGISPYFAVETTRKIKKPYSFTITLSPVNDYCCEKPRWQTLEDLKKSSQVPADAVKMQKVGEENYSDGPFHASTRTYVIFCERASSETHMTSYAYYE